MKSKPGLIIIASYFLINGVYMAYQLVGAWLGASFPQSNLFYNMVPFVFMVSAVGLFLNKGWGRNFTLLASGCYLMLGLVKLAPYFIEQHDPTLLIKGAVDVVIAVMITIYMLRKPIKAKFENSPISLMCIGTFIMLWGVTETSDNHIIKVLWWSLFVVGGCVMLKARQQLRDDGVSTTSE
jgi:lipid-A-disaccharide synthase-like uncharacterized protein